MELIMATTKQVVIFRRDLNVRKGKVGAQVAHASLGAIKSMMRATAMLDRSVYSLEVEHGTALDEWWNEAETTITLGTDEASKDHQLDLIDLQNVAAGRGLTTYLVIDNGTTEFGGVRTMTCLAIGPGYVEQFTGLTDHLKPL
jgi:PTH2 family peptidyl-tRNA hydrolase